MLIMLHSVESPFSVGVLPVMQHLHLRAILSFMISAGCWAIGIPGRAICFGNQCCQLWFCNEFVHIQ